MLWTSDEFVIDEERTARFLPGLPGLSGYLGQSSLHFPSSSNRRTVAKTTVTTVRAVETAEEVRARKAVAQACVRARYRDERSALRADRRRRMLGV